MTYVRFDPPHLLKEYRAKQGCETNGTMLPDYALDELARSVVLGQETLVVRGRWTYPDGRSYLEFAVPTGYIEAVTNYRYDAGARRLRLECPDCGMKDGKHRRGCQA